MQILDNISLIIFIPLWIFLIIMCGRFFGVYVNKKIVYILTLISSASASFVCFTGLMLLKQPVEWTHPFIKINDFTLEFGLYADKTALILGLILFIISFAVQLYSVSYMKSEKKNYRFFALLNLFNFSMAMLLFSPNLYQLYVFWELVGIVSYLLIGFEYGNILKSHASKKVFLINRFGDTALISGIILTTYVMYNSAENVSYAALSLSDLNSISTILMGYASIPVFLIICSLFILGAIVKSAQFPFHIWLQDAMEAKAPVSALLHSATMVTAGVFLLVRLMPFFTLSKILMLIIAAIGALTAVVCSILASVEINPKKVLAYSTSANLGLMFIMLGLGNYKTALIFLAVHAFIKSMLFLSLPQDNKKISYTAFIFFVLGTLSLAGLIFAGMPAKELIFAELISHPTLLKVFEFVIFVSAFYITRLSFLIYKNSEKQREFNFIEIMSVLILIIFNIGLCVLLTRGKFDFTLPYFIALCGTILTIVLNKLNILDKINKTPKLTEKFMYEFVPLIYRGICSLADFVDSKVFGNYKPLKAISKFSVNFVYKIEEKVMNGTVKGIANFAKAFSKRDMIMQSSNVQTYNAYAFILVTAVVVFVIVSYMFIITHFRG